VTSTADQPTRPLDTDGPVTEVGPPAVSAGADLPLDRAAGAELLGGVPGSGYKQGASLVRRADGQVVQLGPLLYGLLTCVDGRRDHGEIAEALSEHLGRAVGEEHVTAIAEKLGGLGLLAGTEHRAPPPRNPLLALRWKVLITDRRWTERLTAPFGWLFSGWVMWPALACFAAVCWFVLVDKGVASATAQAFDSPGLLLLVFALTVVSAGFHELGHAAACRRSGGTPGGMGAGLYLVWPAFYTDVTDAYRLPRRARLRVDLAGLYFNAVVAVATMAVWLVWQVDALLLLVALQLLQMVKQLSPLIRADGYHILADATGVPDLFTHMGPTLRQLVPGQRRQPSALTGWARLLVTVWVLVLAPVMLSLMLSAVLLLPRLLTTAWDSGQHLVARMPSEAGRGDVIGVLASLLQLAALAIPVCGSALVTSKVARQVFTKAASWSAGHPLRRALAILAAAGVVAGLAWAWWPSGQYQQIRPSERGTITSFAKLVVSPARAVRPRPAPVAALAPGTHLAVAMVPVGGASAAHPALVVVPGSAGQPATALVSTGTPSLGSVPHPSFPLTGAEFPFTVPKDLRPGDSQAVAVNTADGSVLYDVAYSLVTVGHGSPVTNANSAFALARCHACTTVAVSFQVVLVIGQSNIIAPLDAAGALNVDCPACTTTALADQLVITLAHTPSGALLAQLRQDLTQLGALPALGAGGTPAAVAAVVAQVQEEVEAQLAASGEVAPGAVPTTAPGGATATTVAGTGSASSSSGAGSGGPTPGAGSATGAPPASTSTVPAASATTTASSGSSGSKGSSGSSAVTTSTADTSAGSPPSTSSSAAAQGSSSGGA
jgi:putative peptide zinc metalloprotease protein